MQPWDKRPDESGQAFSAFKIFLELGPKRQLDKAYRASQGTAEGTKRASGRWKSWAKKHEWAHRANAYDQNLEQIKLAATQKTVQKQAEKAAKDRERVPKYELKIATLAFKRCEEMLSAPGSNPRGLAQLMRAASELARRGTGLPVTTIEDKPASMEGILFESGGQLAQSMPTDVIPEMPIDPTQKPELGASVMVGGDSPLKKPATIPQP